MTDSIAIPSRSTHTRHQGVPAQDTFDTPGGGAGSVSVTPRSTDLPHTPAGIRSSISGDNSGGDRSSSSSGHGNSSNAGGAFGGDDNNDDGKGARLSALEKGKMPLRPRTGGSSPGSGIEWRGAERRASLLSSSISRSEHTVVNIGEPDRPRLITCVKASQGFDWNQDIFLPSYISDHDNSSDLEHRQDPVQDIFITDEEAEMMFPR